VRAALAALALAVLAGACKQEPAEYAGIGPWRVTTTKLKDASGRCDPTDLPDGRKGSYCYLQPLLPIGKQAADVDLYFGGTEPTSPLIELQLKIKVCDPEASDLWLRTHFGAPFETAPGRLFFKNQHLLLAAQLTPQSGRCEIRMFPLSEQAEFERIKALYLAPPKT
jgi:hypothetical protein